ncbi:hypothetical protein FA95DRAFT_709287 [Auriscalpium vulgare]|uniref:Uncharacterized protein n=1 Tax=Auriscalpium vulgare TaxID=40419 RepID=A0ACB8RBJ4_9AGAM|nr:hypothetical protein FA95DRAFT_709287 [Auriscalpium vulgare]
MAPSNVTVQFVEKPTEALAEEAAQVFSGLMPADPAAIAFTAGNISLIEVMARAMIKPIAFVAGDMYTATDDKGELVGFTLFLPPGQNLFITEEQRQLGFYDFMGQLSDEGKVYYPTVLGKDFPAFIDESVGIKETELNTYWCSFAMVRKDYQGKGVAKAMFELAFEKAKTLGVPVALATTNIINVTIYEKIGFELKGYKIMPSPWADWPAWIFATKVPESA